MARKGTSRKKAPGAERNGVPNNKVGAIKPGPAIEPVPASGVGGKITTQTP